MSKAKTTEKLMRELVEERQKDPERFIEKTEVDELINKLVQIEKFHKYQLDKSNTRSRRTDLREDIDKYFGKLGDKNI